MPFGDRFSQIWSLTFARGILYAGTKPASLLASRDHGASWEPVQGLTSHPSADSWPPGAAGLVLHTMVAHPTDPQRIWVGISAAGVFSTEYGGATWERRNRLSNHQACDAIDHPAAPGVGETEYCVHDMMRAPGEGDVPFSAEPSRGLVPKRRVTQPG